MAEQKFIDGKINMNQVVISGLMGGISGGMAGKLAKHMNKISVVDDTLFTFTNTLVCGTGERLCR